MKKKKEKKRKKKERIPDQILENVCICLTHTHQYTFAQTYICMYTLIKFI